ncbi:MAG TPA: hypothetical protein VFX11_05310, partial [Candidatus Kapabacteria bacterium]|nr:hypothetical protein [Candidatus Kapabacteria bacterium]
GLNAPPVGIDIVTDASQLVPWQGTEAEPFPDGDMPGNFALKIWADREDLQAIMDAYFRCNPIFGGSEQKCMSSHVYPGDMVGDVGGVYDAGTVTGGGTGGGTVGGNWGGTIGGVIGSSGAVLEQAAPATGSIGTVTGTTAVTGATKDITAGTAVLNKASVLDSEPLLLKQR